MLTSLLVLPLVLLAAISGGTPGSPDVRAAGDTDAAAALARAMRTHRIVLLGEVHDNARQHALRLAALDERLAEGWRPVLLMEQFDRERQPAIDLARAGDGPGRVERIIAAGADPRGGWNWTFYRPFVERALAHELPIVAANASREDARRVMSEGLAAQGFVAAVAPQLEDALVEAIVEGHCGLVDGKLARAMAAAQIARDQFMADRIAAFVDRGVVLLAGNGHARRDIGVPQWLPVPLRSQVVSIGLLEEGDRRSGGFDHVFFTPPQPREDPCDALRHKPPAR